MINQHPEGGYESNDSLANHPLGAEYAFQELTRDLGFSAEEIALANIRSYIENARREPGPIQDVLGLPEEECGKCGMINVPEENMKYPCPHFHP